MTIRSARFLRNGVAILLLAMAAGFALAADTKKVSDGSEPGRETENPLARQQWFLRGRRTANGKAPAEMLHRAWQQREAMRKTQMQREQQRQAAQKSSAGAPSGSAGALSATWTSLGPAPITGMDPGGTTHFQDATGRVSAVAVDPNDTTGNTVYAGGAYGGVWKSTNATSTATLANGNPNVTWTAMFDSSAPTLSVGAIAVQPGAPTASSRVVLVGTGEPNNAIDSYYGQGILRSADGGATWNTGSIINQTSDGTPTSFKGIGFSKFAFSTGNNQTVVAGGAVTAVGNILNLTPVSGSHSGIYYSSDAGATWKTASATDGGTQIQWARVTDVVYSAKLDRFFAFIAYHGVYESADNTGASWTRLANQPDSADLTLANCPTNPLKTSCAAYRGELAVRSGTGDLYAVIVDSSDNDKGVWQANFDTSNNITSWTAFSTTQIDNCEADTSDNGCGLSQGFYNLALAAIPNGSNTDLYVGAVNVFKCQVSASNSTCSTWLNLTHEYPASGTCSSSSTYRTMHVDFHSFSWNLTGGAAEGTVMYFGNDGGVYRTLNSFNMNNGACDSTGNPWDNLNDTLGSLTQFIAMTNHPSDATVIMGGTQDNGTPAMSTSDGQTSGKQWFEAWGGDGGFSAIDPAATATTGLWYATNTDVSIVSCNHGAQCITGFPFSPDIYNQATHNSSPSFFSTPNFPDSGAFYTPWILDPQDATKIIIGTCRVWRGAANTPSNWGLTSFTNALSNKLIDGTSTTACTGTPSGSSDIDKEAVSALAAGGPKNSSGSSVIWAGTASGTGTGTAGVYVTTNATTGTATWSNVTGSINPNGFPVASIAVDGTDATGKTAYAAIQGFMGNSNGAGHLWKTTNAGGTWTDVGIGLPDSPANAVVIDPASNSTLYVGTDVGVYISQDGGATWSLYGTGLPNVSVFDLKVFNSGGTGKLRAATHGRGVWEAPLAGGTSGCGTGTPSYTLTLPTATTVLATDSANSKTTTINISYTAQNGDLMIAGTCSDSTIAGSSCAVNNGNAASVTCNSTVTVPMAITVPAATSLTAGTSNVSVNTQDTSASAAAPQSGTAPVAINADFTIASQTASQTVTAGNSANYTISITPAPSPENTAVAVTCSGLPSKASCGALSITPGSAAATGTLTIATTGTTTSAAMQRRIAPFYALLFPLPLGLALVIARRRGKAAMWAGMALAMTLLLAMSACGGGSSTTPHPITVPGTPAGTYTITVTGTAGTATHSTTVTLVVQ